jgi:predicted nucleic acid-binding protein
MQDDWRLSATIWATLQANGTPLGDTDILIGVYAARRGAHVITRNRPHFQMLTAHLPLTMEDWLSPQPS